MFWSMCAFLTTSKPPRAKSNTLACRQFWDFGFLRACDRGFSPNLLFRLAAVNDARFPSPRTGVFRPMSLLKSIFQPDSFIVADVAPSPNFDVRKDNRAPDMILLHYTGMQTGEAALHAPHRGRRQGVRALCGVRRRPHRPMRAGERRAWHAGVSSWAGETDINSRSIGIEIVNPGHEFGYPDFPLRQIAAVIALCRVILTRRGPISADRILGAFRRRASRKQDPGEKFPWRLAERIRRRALGARRRRSISTASGSSPATAATR